MSFRLQVSTAGATCGNPRQSHGPFRYEILCTAATATDATGASLCHLTLQMELKNSQPSEAAESAVSQKYLIFAILSCVPDRQRTLRELELGRTLVRDGDKCGDPCS